MRYITLPLDEFVRKVYKIDIEKIGDPFSDFYCLSHDWITVNEDEVAKVREELKLPKTISDSRVKDAIRDVKMLHYEVSYANEYYNEVCNMLRKKIEKDFQNLQSFFADPDDITVDGELLVKSIDFHNNTITFEGKIKKLEAYILNCINGYGLFCYRDLEEFKETTYPKSIKKRIESHLYWLSYFEEIYCTTYGMFRLDLQYVDYYATMGNTDYTIEDLREYLDAEIYVA
jgi:hypothetical protein